MKVQLMICFTERLCISIPETLIYMFIMCSGICYQLLVTDPHYQNMEDDFQQKIAFVLKNKLMMIFLYEGYVLYYLGLASLVLHWIHNMVLSTTNQL